MFSWYKYLIVSLVFSHPGFWSGNLFLIAPFPDLCLLVPFHLKSNAICSVFFVYVHLTEVILIISESLIHSAFWKIDIS